MHAARLLAARLAASAARLRRTRHLAYPALPHGRAPPPLAAAAAAAAAGCALLLPASAAAHAGAPEGLGEFRPDSRYAALVAEMGGSDDAARMRAVQAVCLLAGDGDAHAGLVASGAVGALAARLRDTGGDGGAGDAERVAVLRALADLARTQAGTGAFCEGGVDGAVVGVLRDAGVGGEGWWAWVKGMVWGGGALEEEEGVDLRSGVVYHAVRCVANLSRETGTHAWLMREDVLSPMLSVLGAVDAAALVRAECLADVVGDEQRADTVRFAALSVAALCKTHAQKVLDAGGGRALVELLAQGTDGVAQMYAAGGVRNVARCEDGSVHRRLVVDGVADALASGLAARGNTQTQVFCALALRDLLTTEHRKAVVICGRLAPAFEPFAELLESGNAWVATCAYRVLDAVLSKDVDERGMALSAAGRRKYGALCEVVVQHVGPMVRGPAAKGDHVAMGAVAALALCGEHGDVLIAKGVLPTLVSALDAKNEYGSKALVALARLSARPQHAQELVLRGALRAAMARGASSSGDLRWAAAALANLARVERHRPDIGHGGLPVLLRALHAREPDARREGARALLNLTIGGVSRVLSAQGGALVPLAKIAGTMDGDARAHAVGAIAAISELYGFAMNIVELSSIAILLRAVEADRTLARDVARTFAQLSNHVESHAALARDGAVAWLVRAVSRGDASADTLHHATAALCNVSYTQGLPHDELRKAGAVSALTGLSSGIYTPYVSQCARLALANLRGGAPPVLQHAEPHPPVDPV